jgi:hypothetical protein
MILDDSSYPLSRFNKLLLDVDDDEADKDKDKPQPALTLNSHSHDNDRESRDISLSIGIAATVRLGVNVAITVPTCIALEMAEKARRLEERELARLNFLCDRDVNSGSGSGSGGHLTSPIPLDVLEQINSPMTKKDEKDDLRILAPYRNDEWKRQQLQLRVAETRHQQQQVQQQELLRRTLTREHFLATSTLPPSYDERQREVVARRADVDEQRGDEAAAKKVLWAERVREIEESKARSDRIDNETKIRGWLTVAKVGSTEIAFALPSISLLLSFLPACSCSHSFLPFFRS